MSVVGTVAAALVGVALIAAGLFKLLDGPAWPRQAADLGVARRVALVVPWIELLIGVALIVRVARPWPAVAAIVLLLVFTVVIVRRLLDGSRPPCACFGSRSKRPLGAIHVVRNIVLLGVAGAAAIWG